MVSYADDSYVAIAGHSIDDIKKEIEKCMELHVNELLSLGMIVNTKKTEVVLFNKRPQEAITINCHGEMLRTKDQMKVLGVLFEKTLSWEPHIENSIKKMTRLTHGLKFLHRKLTELFHCYHVLDLQVF